MLRDGHFMAAHMQGLGKLTSKFFLMRKQHDHVKGPTEQATARSLQLTSIGRLLINLHNDTAPSDYAGRLASLTHVVLSVQQSTMKPDPPWH
jgi:hypothetical protein